MTTTADNSVTSTAGPYPKRWLALGILLAAAFMDLLDVTIVNIALPDIRSDLSAGYAASQWVVTAYTLAFGLGLITGGRMGDRYGRKRLFLLGIALFTLSSLVCGIAPNVEALVTARAVQGVASALMVPQIMATVYAIFPANERGGASGAYGAVTGLAAVAGPLLGGVFVAYDVFGLGWRAVFLVNVPIGVAALFAAYVLVPETKSDFPLRMDLLGVLLVSASLLLLLYPLVQGRTSGWPAWMIVAMVAAPLVMLVYALHARAKERRDHSSLVPLRLFRQPGFSAGTVVLFVFDATMIGFFLAISLTLQIGLGYSAMRTGLLFLPWAIGAALTSGAADGLVGKLGRHLLTTGALVMAGGMLWFALVLEPGASWWELAPGLFLAGLGMGGVIGPAFTVAGAHVEGRDAGAAAGSLSAAVQLGNATGAALLGVLLFSPLASAAGGAFDGNEHELRSKLSAAGAPAAEVREISARLRPCFLDYAAEENPDNQPKSCAPVWEKAGRDPAVKKAVDTVVADSRAEMFTDTFGKFVWFTVGGLVVVALLAQSMPREVRGYESWGEEEQEDGQAEPKS
ncbi:MFS transporter [Streptomyces sp. NBC_01795]|uniref:MFS transporter n=1 Tax=unclassified Streptomyces TaxID=2593676 RepID=UPI002DD85279|nr:MULTISPECIES: MFS transporter [unclassified Streptomyces]WSA95499.1 MFS transporter [Streptomyces sp. NBC_01795]WSS11878.1 MFS transporter [Streptomyces sp. NBC_01186]